MRTRASRVLVTACAVLTLAACGGARPTEVPGTAAPVGVLTPTGSAVPSSGGTFGSGSVSREIGGPLWVVALAVSDRSADDPKLLAAGESVGARHTVKILSVECDPGIRPGLKLRPEKRYWYAALYFETEEAAFAFKTANRLKVVGVVSVTPVKGCR